MTSKICDTCNIGFVSKAAHIIHKKSKHLGEQHNACNEYEATTHSYLTVHIQSVHEDKRYLCEVCNKEYTDKRALRRHKKSAHEGITYKCKTCDAQFNQKSNLYSHIKSRHKGVKFPV